MRRTEFSDGRAKRDLAARSDATVELPRMLQGDDDEEVPAAVSRRLLDLVEG